MNADHMLREQGSRDRRLLPAAITIWASSLFTHQMFAYYASLQQSQSNGEQTRNFTNAIAQWVISPPSTMMVVAVITGAATLLIVFAIALQPRARRAGMLCVCLAAAIIATMTAIASDTRTWLDPATQHAQHAKNADKETIIAQATIMTPILVSDQRGYACQADVRFDAITVNGVERRSFASARLYAQYGECTVLQRAAQYRFTGIVRNAEYGRMPLWMLVDTASDSRNDTVTQSRAPPWYRRVVTRMQHAFFRITETLDEQGRILVPGMTMGVLGQDYFDAETPSEPVNDTYANAVEEYFRKAGIMHLMAVSGGHFVLLASLIRRIGMWLLADRRIIAVLMALAYVALAAVVFPGDSVTRALIMGLMGAVAYACGRRAQALSALCWTVIGTVILKPDMSRSYGFALSCAAVLGIVLYANRIERVLSHVMPQPIAQAAAMTIAAQMFTVPIQVLMEPELPLLSVLANLLVSPLVSLATMAGLMGLCCAWCVPWLALVLVRIASWCTLIMERIATWLGGSDWAAMAWPGNAKGVLLTLTLEFAVFLIMQYASHWLRRRRIESGLPGERFGRLPAQRVRLTVWWHETLHLLLHG
ncbi:comec [Bifidobacterium saguini DSM 23967]|uniref:Comec n=3 Tax=Bifidobacterium saguini TaxID=762210 RepID=A0A087DDA4_9BIFI|nr:ComEC/Rec2 family competence protein [Bifidobacterium saguini]KFI93504.1 comec [Bifidobacterium saguini DSM 23967]QTB90687.1 ComEC/Rec2 family competence protein [Bifidobacterium saguini]